MGDLIKGSSALAALPTLLYVGFAQYKNRVDLLKSVDPEKLANYLSIPHEMLPLGICMVYGVSYRLMKSLEKHDDKKIAGTRIRFKTLAFGAATGIFLSLVGRFGLGLPSKLFRIDRSEAYTVHLIAPVLYMAIFVYLEYLMDSNI